MKKFTIIAKIVNDKAIIQHTNKRKDVDEWINISESNPQVCELSIYQKDGLGYNHIWQCSKCKIGF